VHKSVILSENDALSERLNREISDSVCVTGHDRYFAKFSGSYAQTASFFFMVVAVERNACPPPSLPVISTYRGNDQAVKAVRRSVAAARRLCFFSIFRLLVGIVTILSKSLSISN
jgi:hypothetical protein